MTFSLRVCCVLFYVLSSCSVTAQSSDSLLWSEDVRAFSNQEKKQFKNTSTAILQLNHPLLETLLSKAPKEFVSNPKDGNCIISLPLGNGAFSDFRVHESSIVEEGLLKKYPFLKTYTAQSLDNPSHIARLDFTPKGFHAVIRTAEDLIFVDPLKDTKQKNTYQCYHTKGLVSDEDFRCHANTIDSTIEKAIQNKSDISAVGDQLRTFRIAIAATAEYTQYHGGTLEDGLAAIVSTLNRINLLYELEVATRLVLVENNDQLIFTDADTDPYNNSKLSEMIYQNQTLLDDKIGFANYDIGHVFGTKGGGLAGVGGVCFHAKAWGATGLTTPEGDAFDIIYAAHEMGHQLNATHTFNNCNGQGGGAAAFEPGSGTSLMAYAGLCGHNNVQLSTDLYFHAGSFQQMVNGANGCAVFQATNNTPPQVTVLENDNLTIPMQTPFELRGEGTDVDGDVLLYTWDQMDRGIVSPLGQPSGSAPLFRFQAPSTNPVRVFPQIENLIQNIDSPAEILPNYARTMNFNFTARDNSPGCGGVSHANFQVAVSDSAGPFEVTYPSNSNEIWVAGETKTILWDVANTDVAPINCTEVSILLSQDGGRTYPIVLADFVPNAGSATITVPNAVGNKNRIKIKARENIFFDISNVDFEIIDSAQATFMMAADEVSITACNTETVEFAIDFSLIGAFQDNITFSTVGLPQGVAFASSSEAIYTSQKVYFQVSNLQHLGAGQYNFSVIAQGGGIQNAIQLSMNLLDNTPYNFSAIYPLDGDRLIPHEIKLEWAILPTVISYEIQVATSPKFGSTIIEQRNTIAAQATLQGLNAFQVYYWRIRAENSCGLGEYSPIFSFQTQANPCRTYMANDLPLTIDNSSANTTISTIQVETDVLLSDVNVPTIVGTHEYISDLTFELAAPNGTTIQLTGPVCGSDQNFNFGFDDEATESIINCPPTNAQIVHSIQALSSFQGASSQGTWQLIVSDNIPLDGGALQNWSLELCTNQSPVIDLQLISNPMLLVAGMPNKSITKDLLEVQADDASMVSYILRSIPQFGHLKRNNTILNCGDVFTQEDINSNLLSYEPPQNFLGNDYFIFDAITETGGWLEGLFDINITNNDLALNTQLLQAISCFEANDARIILSPSGGFPPYQYSLDGENYDADNVFDNLGAGNHVFYVKDAYDFATTAQLQLLHPPEIALALQQNENTIRVETSGGTGLLQCSIDGVNFDTTTVFSNLDNGFYTITVRDENGCKANSSTNISVNTLAISASIEQEIQCAAGQDGKLSVAVTGGKPPYLYSIDGVNFQASAHFENLKSGTYNITVEEFEGFTKVSEPIQLLAPPSIELNTQTNLNTLMITASGGTGTLLYSLDGVTFQTNNTFYDLPTGEQTVYVQDANGCMSISTVLIEYEVLNAIANVEAFITCQGAGDASVAITVLSGTAPYQYRLGEGSFQSSALFENLRPGIYPFYVQDANGFLFEGNAISIGEPAALILETKVLNNQITAYTSGGTGSIEYQLDESDWQLSPIFEDVPIGTYILRARDANACLVSTPVHITTTSSEAVKQALDFVLFPNPNNGDFTIQLESSDDWDYTIKDSSGRVVNRGVLDSYQRKYSLSLSFLTGGVYQLILKNDEAYFTQSFVVE